MRDAFDVSRDGGRAGERELISRRREGKEFKSGVTSEERKRRNKKVGLGMRQQRGGEVQEEDCRGAHWRRSDEEGENTRLQKTDGRSEAFETRKWKTKAIWTVQAKGWGPRGLHADVGSRV